MKRITWVLAAVFSLAFLGATLLNAGLVLSSRRALARGALRRVEGSSSLRYQVAVIIPETVDSFFVGLVDGIEADAKASASAVLFFRYQESMPEKAARYFEMALRARLDGIIMYLARSEDLAAYAEQARRAGIPFVPIGKDPPVGGAAGFIGSSSLLQGIEAGALISTRLGSSARVGLILPPEGKQELEREPLYQGVSASLAAFSGAGIIAAQRAKPGILSGEEAATSMLRSHPAINAIVCSSSVDTLGAAQVVIDMNKVGRVLIVGTDETPEILRYIDKGVIVASIIVDSRWIGRQALASFTRLRSGLPVGSPVEAGFSVRTATEPDL